MKTVLILEGNSANLVAESRKRVGVSQAENYGNVLKLRDTEVVYRIVAPYETPLTDENLEAVDGVVLTGSGVPWSADAPEAKPLRKALKDVFEKGLPVLASCNGMQLAAVLLGGQLRASPNGMEVGLALEIERTKAGKNHPFLEGRSDRYAVPCVHRDEVHKLPDNSVLLATNAHSPVQAFAYEHGGVDFWGMQYHPEYSGAWVADLLRAPGTIWQDLAQAEDLDRADTDALAAQRLGARADDLTLEVRTTELWNWLAHVDAGKTQNR